MDLKTFNKEYSMILEEIGMKKDGTVASHTLPATISVISDDPYDETEYQLVGIEPDQMIGCGCFSGITLVIRKVP